MKTVDIIRNQPLIKLAALMPEIIKPCKIITMDHCNRLNSAHLFSSSGITYYRNEQTIAQQLINTFWYIIYGYQKWK
jgi:hypothetical protein